MKFAVGVDAFEALLHRACEVVERKIERSIPILGNVLIEVEGATVSVTATDLNRWFVERMPVALDAIAGSTTVPGRMLHDIARKLQGELTAELEDDTTLILRAGRSRFKLLTLPPADFPAPEFATGAPGFQITSANLRRLIARAGFAMCNDAARYYLNGLHIHQENGRLRGVATDGHRLARVDVDIELNGASSFPSVIIPRDTVLILDRLFGKSAEPIVVELRPTACKVSDNSRMLITKLIDGTFPDYKRVIPDNPNVLKADVRNLHDTIDRVGTVVEDGRGIKLSLNDDSVVISAATRADQVGAASEELEVQFESVLDIGVNPRFVLDIIDRLDCEIADIRLKTEGDPILFVDQDAVFVVMPMRA
jgi:DNA polymerase-3 subunit beta